MTERTRGQWQGYVASGKSKEERNQRLLEVPEELRAEVKRHVSTLFSIIIFNKNRKRKK